MELDGDPRLRAESEVGVTCDVCGEVMLDAMAHLQWHVAPGVLQPAGVSDGSSGPRGT